MNDINCEYFNISTLLVDDSILWKIHNKTQHDSQTIHIYIFFISFYSWKHEENISRDTKEMLLNNLNTRIVLQCEAFKKEKAHWIEIKSLTAMKTTRSKANMQPKSCWIIRIFFSVCYLENHFKSLQKILLAYFLLKLH